MDDFRRGEWLFVSEQVESAFLDIFNDIGCEPFGRDLSLTDGLSYLGAADVVEWGVGNGYAFG